MSDVTVKARSFGPWVTVTVRFGDVFMSFQLSPEDARKAAVALNEAADAVAPSAGHAA